jgi:hypothetical protein
MYGEVDWDCDPFEIGAQPSRAKPEMSGAPDRQDRRRSRA